MNELLKNALEKAFVQQVKQIFEIYCQTPHGLDKPEAYKRFKGAINNLCTDYYKILQEDYFQGCLK